MRRFGSDKIKAGSLGGSALLALAAVGAALAAGPNGGGNGPSAPVAPADRDSSGQSADQGRPARAPGADVPSGPRDRKDKTMDDLFLEHQRSVERRREKRSSADEREARVRSRGKFARASRKDALAVAKDEHRPIFQLPLSPLQNLPEGAHVERYLSDFQALVSGGPGGDKTVAESTVPLQVDDESGQRAPVDLGLEQHGGALQPGNPLVPVEVDAGGGGAVTFPDANVRIDAAEPGSHATADLISGKAFFADTATDTDMLVAATPSGVELFHQLRSESSPEEIPLHFDLPAGAELRDVGGRFAREGNSGDGLGAEVVKDTTKLVGVSAPKAWDADGAPVPVSYAVRDGSFVMKVEHRGRDFKYPLMVDPAVNDFYQNWKNNGAVSFGYETWRGYPEGGGEYWGGFRYSSPWGAPKFNGYMGDSYLGRGLYIYNRSQQYFGSGEYAEWQYRMPRGAYIYRADFAWLLHDAWGNPNNCIVEGVFAPSRNNWDSGTWWNWEPPSATANSPWMACNNWYSGGWGHGINWVSNPADGNYALFRNGFWGSNWAINFTTYTGGSIMFLGDRRAPSMSAPTMPTGWVNGNGYMQVRAWDDGLGARRIQISSPALSTWSSNYTYDQGCAGTYGARCNDWVQISAYVNNLPEGGATPVQASGWDVTDNGNSATWYLKVDRSAPTISPSGSLWTTKFLRDASYTVSATATDGSNSSTAAQRSGVKSFKVYLDNVEQDTASGTDTTCPSSSCSKTRNFTLNAADTNVREGRHTIKLVATDQLNQSSTTQWDVIVDRSDPALLDLSGALRTAPFVDGNSSGLKVRAQDFGSPGSGANLLTESSFEGSLSSVAGTGATITRAAPAFFGAHGTWVAQLAATATGTNQIRNDSDRISVSPGEVLTVSAHARSAVEGRAFSVVPRWLNSSGTLMSEGSGTSSTASSAVWRRASAVVTAPAGAAYLAWGVTFTGVATTGELNYVDAVQIERGDLLSAYGPRPAEVPAQERSGVTKMELWSKTAGSTETPVKRAGTTWSCSAGSCPNTWSVTPTGIPEGRQELWVSVEDQVGHRIESTHWTTVVDRSVPSPVTTSGSLKDAQGTSIFAGTYSLTVDSADGSAAPPASERSGVTSTRIYVDSTPSDGDPGVEQQPTLATQPCPQGSCAMHRTWTFRPADWPAGDYTVRVRVTDQLGNQAPEQTISVQVKLDNAKPTLTTSGGLQPPLATGRDMHMAGDDADSGVAQFDVWVDPDATPTSDEAKHVKTYGCSPSCLHHEEDDFILPADVPEGKHTILARVTDASGLTDEKRFDVNVVDLLVPQSRSKLGLEHWFQYDDTDAGGGSNVYVNAETGNAVWHSVPIVNPGRGLSTVVNLTYNSQDRGGILGSTLGHIPVVDLSGQNLSNDLPGLSYSDAGVGFSLAISGPTRLNEPLGGVLVAQAVDEGSALLPDYGGSLPAVSNLHVTLTDADGTVHTFTRSGDKWIAPPGLNMRLRRYKPGGTPVNPIADKWALTRADGVTHFFDNLGYLTRSEDRNGNALTYTYETYDALTGNITQQNTALCPTLENLGKKAQIDSGPLLGQTVLCGRRVAKVTDAGGRDMTVSYRQEALVDGGYGNLPRKLWYESAQIVGGHSRIDHITDHAGRRYDFAYDDAGFLTKLTEAAGSSEQRVTELEYEGWDSNPIKQIGQDRQLTAVVEKWPDRADRRTVVRYVDPADRHGIGAVTPGVVAQPRQVCGVTKRNTGENLLTPQVVAGQQCRSARSDLEKTYAYDRPSSGPPARFTITEVLNRAIGGSQRRTATTTTDLDAAGRPTTVTDALGKRTVLTWDDAVNAVKSVEEAQGSGDAARTELTYDGANGTGSLLTQTEYPNWPATDSPRTTTFCYQYSNGVHHSQVAGQDGTTPATPSCTGAALGDGAFVADLTEIRQPRGGTGASFEIQRNGAGDYLGNVITRWNRPDRQGPSASTTYDGQGRITSETDETLHSTSYNQFDPAGQPQSVVDPESKVWSYRYDALENVTSVVDPRATDPSGTEGNPFTTTLKYDAFDRLVTEKVPHDHAASDASKRFNTTTRNFDRNGNLTSETDPAGVTTQLDYTAMDKPKRTTAPGDAGSELTDYLYDDADRLIARIDPSGDHSSPSAGDQVARCSGAPTGPAHMTRYCLDDTGRRVAEVRSGDDPAALVTAFGFDQRDNVVGIIDPLRNAGKTVSQAVASAGNSAAARYTYSYNKLDERTDEFERPTEQGSSPLHSHFDYDANGNRQQALPPRAYQGGGSPDTSYATKWFYDSRDQIEAVRTPAGCTAYARYDDGKVKSETSPRGTDGAPDDCAQGGPFKYFTKTYTYDGHGDVVSRSVPYAKDQYGRSDSEFANWKVTYARDAVGNPTFVRDARMNAANAPGAGFQNTFYDDNALRSTERPSFWNLDWGGGQYDSPDPGRQFTEDGSDADLGIQDGGPALAEAGDRTRTAADSGGNPDLPSSHAEGKFASVDRQDPGDMLPDAGTTSFEYDPAGRITAIVDAAGGRGEIGYDGRGRVTRKQWPFDSGRPIVHRYAYDLDGNLKTYTDARGLDTAYAYDGYDQRKSETAPGSFSSLSDTSADPQVTRYGYDGNGNLTSRRTPRGDAYTFQFTYDSVDRLLTETNPASEKWAYGYDASGNLTCEESPRGHAASACDPASQFATGYEFDTSDRMSKMTKGFGGDKTTTFGYDADGNRTEVVSPGSASHEGGDPARRKVAAEYDGRGLPWRETTSTDGGSDKRTTLREYDPNGNVRRLVDPTGVTSGGLPKVADSGGSGTGSDADLKSATWHATVREYDSNDLVTNVWLPWSKEGSAGDTGEPQGPNDAEAGGDARREVQTFQRSGSLDRVQSVVSPHQTTDSKAPRTSYTYFDNGWVKTQSEEKLVPPGASAPVRERLITYDYDQEGAQTRWQTENTGSTRGRIVKRAFYPDGTLKRRWAIKRQPDGDHTVRCYAYFYNDNRSLTHVEDFPLDVVESGDPVQPDCADRKPPDSNATDITRDPAERETVVNESWRGGRDTVFGYDDNGNVATRKTDGVRHTDGSYDGADAKVTTFDYDALDRETQNVVSPSQGANRTTATTWWDSGDMRKRTKQNGTDETRYFSSRGEIAQKVRDPQQGSTDTQDYEYDREGNRTKDERGTELYNPRRQLVKWTRGSGYANAGNGTDKSGTTVTYTRNDSGEIERKVDTWQPQGFTGPTTTTFNYAGERLLSSETTAPTQQGDEHSRADYTYDDFGSTVKVETSHTGPGQQPPPPPNGTPSPSNCDEVPNAAEDNVTRYCFDEFERMILSRGEGVTKPTSYAYDGLDRRDTKTVEENGQQKRSDYAYVGTSSLLSRETDSAGEAKSYDYDSQGHRLGQAAKKPSDSQPTYRTYETDANGSVTGLEDSNGRFGPSDTDTYLYDPYGSNEKVGAATEKDDAGLSSAAKDNPFRFEGFYYDSGIKSYDMHAREYRPDTGRFLSQDRYESAVGDKLLQADPLTQNRYAFAGGNPVNEVEFDGHATVVQKQRLYAHPHGRKQPRPFTPVFAHPGRPGNLQQSRGQLTPAQYGRALARVKAHQDSVAALQAATRLVDHGPGGCFGGFCHSQDERQALIEDVFYRITEGRPVSPVARPHTSDTEDVNDLTDLILFAAPAGKFARWFLPKIGLDLTERSGSVALRDVVRRIITSPRRAIVLRRGYNRDVKAIYGDIQQEFGFRGAIPSDARGRTAAIVAYMRRRAIGAAYKEATPRGMRGAIFGRNFLKRGYDKYGPTWETVLKRYKTPDEIVQASARPNGRLARLGEAPGIRALLGPGPPP